MAWNPVFTVPVSTAVENFYFGGGYQSFPFTQVGQSYPPCVNLQAWPTPYFPVYPYMPYPSLHTVAVHPGWSRPYAGGYCFYPPWPSVLFQASSSQSGTVPVETRYASVAVGSRDDSVTECSTVSGSSAAVSEGSENRVTQDWNRVEPVIISPAEVGASDVGGNPTEVNTVSASTLASRLVGGNAVASVELRNTAELTLTSLASFEPQNVDTFDARKVAITPSESTTGKSLSAVQISLVKLSTDCSSDVPPRDQRKMVQNKLCASMSDKSRKRKVSLCRSGLSVSVHETLQKSSTGDPFLRLGDSLIDKAETDVKKEAGDHSKCLTKSRRRRRRNAVKRANLAGKVTNLPPFEQLKKPEPTCTTSSHSEHEKFRCVERRRKAKVGGRKSRVGISSETVVLTMQVGDDSHFALGQKKIKATVTSSDVSPAESSFGSKAQVGCDSGRKIAGSEAKRLNDRDHAACFTSLTPSLLMPASQGPHQFSDLSPAESLKTRLSHDCLDSDEVGNFARTQQMNVANEIRASETSSVCHNDNEEAYMVIDSDGSSDSGTEIPRQEFLPEMLMSFSEGELTSQSSAVACGSTDGLDTVGKCSKIRRSLSKGEITDDDDDGDNDVDDDVFTVEVFSDDGNITEGKEEAVHLLCQESLSEEPNQHASGQSAMCPVNTLASYASNVIPNTSCSSGSLKTQVATGSSRQLKLSSSTTRHFRSQSQSFDDRRSTKNSHALSGDEHRSNLTALLQCHSVHHYKDHPFRARPVIPVIFGVELDPAEARFASHVGLQRSTPADFGRIFGELTSVADDNACEVYTADDVENFSERKLLAKELDRMICSDVIVID